MTVARYLLYFLYFSILRLYYTKKVAETFVPPSKPDYNDLELKDSSRLHLDPKFIAACEAMAGYYQDSSRNPSLNKTLLIAGVNRLTKLCDYELWSIKFLPISLDEGIYSYLTSNKTSVTYLMGNIPGREKVVAEPSAFGGKNFNLIGCRKMEAVAGALKLGYDVIFSDVDIAVLRDPIDYLFFPHVDYTHSTNNGCNKKWKFSDVMEGNTGFYAVKSNPQTIRTWDLTYRLCARSPLYDDQTIFWLVLRTNSNPSPLPYHECPKPLQHYISKKVQVPSEFNPFLQVKNTSSTVTESNSSYLVNCPLDNCLFSAGNIRNQMQIEELARALKSRGDAAVMVHANWLSGKDNKKTALQTSGLWIARRAADRLQGKYPNIPSLKKEKKTVVGYWTCVEPRGLLLQGVKS